MLKGADLVALVRGRRAVVLGLALLLFPANASAATLPAGFQERTLASGLQGPTAVDWAPDGRMFIAQKGGELKVVQPGSTSASTILDISSRVNHAADRGLLGLAVDSAYASNHFVYLLYTYDVAPLSPDSSANETVSQLLRVVVNPDNSIGAQTVILGTYTAGACPAASDTLDCIPSNGPSHSVGTVLSAPDGTLWVGSGDGANFSGVDPRALRTYDERSMAGKVLHVDRNGRGLPGHPFCTTDTNLTHVCTKVHSKGFRNPFRFTLRPNGGLAVADVGWNKFEEIDLVPAAGGKSYGWPCYEASVHTFGYRDLPECPPEYAKEGTPNAHVLPDFEYDRTVGTTVIGGPTYTGSQYPAGYPGSIFYGDYGARTIKRLTLDSQGSVTGSQDFATGIFGVVGLYDAPNGDLVYINIGSFSNDGVVGQISYGQGNRAPVAAASATPTSGQAPLTVDFSSAGSSDPDGDTLSYDWDFGDGTAHSSAANPRHVYQQTGTFTARLTVGDGRGGSDSKAITISSGGNAPVATIAAPLDEANYRDGDTITLRGSGSDQQDGALPASALEWRVVLHHGTHLHPFNTFTGVAQTSFVAARDHDADSFYEITLTATDSNGLKGSRTIQIRPETVTARLDSTPDGAAVSYGGRGGTAPYTQATAIGYDTTISAETSFVAGGRRFYFDSWSDGGARVHDIRVPATDFALRAFYKEDKAQGQPATASSSESAELGPGNAVDGHPGTRWSSSFSDGQHWQVDLGRARAVDAVALNWEDAYASSYQIMTSLDGATFSLAATQSIGSPGWHTTSFARRNARYVRVVGVTRATGFGISFWDAHVLGPSDASDSTPPETTITSGPSGTVSSTSASFAFSSEAGARFECRLDGGTWGGCTSPKSYTGLSTGAHTFDVRATDAAGNTDPTPATRSWSVGAPSGYASTVLGTPGLFAYYRLGDAGTTASDSNGTSHGVYVNGPARSSSLVTDGDGSHDFDGVNDFVDLDPAAFGTPATLSVEAWVRVDTRKSGEGHHFLVSNAREDWNDGFSLWVNRSNRPQFQTAKSSSVWAAATGPALTLGTTAHLVGVYTGSEVRLYVDGVRQASVPYTGGVGYSSFRDLVLGGQSKSFRRELRFLDGALDEVALYRSALTDAQVKAHYDAGKPPIALRLASRRISAKGPVAVSVTSTSRLAVTGTLSAKTSKAVAASAKRIKLKGKAFRVGAGKRVIVKLKLPPTLRRLLGRKRTLTLQLRARATDADGKTSIVTRRVSPRVKRRG